MAYITGKQRASRIPLDYYKHPDRMVRTKRFLTWGAGLLTIVWIATAFFPTGVRSLGDTRFSHGPVATAHQPIDSDCAACHVNFAVFASGKPFKGDQKCQQCHYEGDLATHHASQKVEMTSNCGGCHSDHHGRDWNLNRVVDRDCTNCHKDLKASMAEGTARYDNEVTSFAEKHPAFRDLGKDDPGKLKFNHKYHMTPGIVLTEGGKPFTLANLPEGSQRERYRQPGQKDTDAVKLECASCHTPEARDEIGKEGRPNPTEDRAGWEKAVQEYFRAKLERRGNAGHNLLPPRKPGAYMAPIVYENHCAACHPLDFDPATKQQAPHRLQPDKLKTFLTDYYKENQSTASAPTRPTTLLPLPGKRSGGPVATPSVQERVDGALRLLLEGKRACGECHLAEGGGSVNLYTKNIDVPKNGAGGKDKAPLIPEIWLKHARFDHSAHTSRGINCIECHKDAYPNKDPAVNEREVLDSSAMLRQGAEKVMIGNIKECRQCHSPKPEPKFSDAGLQARFDCAECHTYHNGKAGLGNAAGAFHGQPRRELEAWLRRK
jgi:hypothetical protein